MSDDLTKTNARCHTNTRQDRSSVASEKQQDLHKCLSSLSSLLLRSFDLTCIGGTHSFCLETLHTLFILLFLFSLCTMSHYCLKALFCYVRCQLLLLYTIHRSLLLSFAQHTHKPLMDGALVQCFATLKELLSIG